MPAKRGAARTKRVMRDAEAPLPPHRAFVVQFRSGRALGGRVEHVVSGRVARFRSLAELGTVVKQLLREVAR